MKLKDVSDDFGAVVKGGFYDMSFSPFGPNPSYDDTAGAEAMSRLTAYYGEDWHGCDPETVHPWESEEGYDPEAPQPWDDPTWGDIE